MIKIILKSLLESIIFFIIVVGAVAYFADVRCSKSWLTDKTVCTTTFRH